MIESHFWMHLGWRKCTVVFFPFLEHNSGMKESEKPWCDCDSAAPPPAGVNQRSSKPLCYCASGKLTEQWNVSLGTSRFGTAYCSLLRVGVSPLLRFQRRGQRGGRGSLGNSRRVWPLLSVGQCCIRQFHFSVPRAFRYRATAVIEGWGRATHVMSHVSLFKAGKQNMTRKIIWKYVFRFCEWQLRSYALPVSLLHCWKYKTMLPPPHKLKGSKSKFTLFPCMPKITTLLGVQKNYSPGS